MLNQIGLVGRVKELPVSRQTSQGNTVAQLLLEVDRNFKNADGSLSTDVFQVTLWRGIAETCLNVCQIGTVLAIRGRLQANVYQNDESRKFYNAEVIAEKVSFI